MIYCAVLKLSKGHLCVVKICYCCCFSYQRTAALSQFIIHRGVIFTVMQVVFSAVFYLASIMLYPGFLIVG